MYKKRIGRKLIAFKYETVAAASNKLQELKVKSIRIEEIIFKN